MSAFRCDVSIIVVSYNTAAMTQAALDSVLLQTKDVSYEVIAVDNASTDGSAGMIENHPIGADLIRLGENIGFARANTLAARRARGTYILLLNPDTVVLDSAIDKLVAFARSNPKARIWGGRTVFSNGTLNPSSCWQRMTPWNVFCRTTGLTGLFPHSSLLNGEAYAGWNRDSVREVDIVSGCFFLIERELWDGLGGFDPLFFMYGEEADLCLRARGFSARPIITPDATIVHYGGASERARAGKMVKLLAAKMALITRHWQPPLVPLGQSLLTLWPLTRWIACLVKATLTGSRHAQQTANEWHEIWARRTEWRNGYRTPVPAAASAIAAPPAFVQTAR